MSMANSNDTLPGSSGGAEQSEPPAENQHGLNGLSGASRSVWMNTPGAIESRKVLKEVLIEEMFPAEMISDLFDRYELHGL